MCGRYATTHSALDLAALFDAADETGGGLSPDYNVAPTDPVPIVRRSRHAAGAVLSMARWGLVPPWAADPSGAARMINARAETVATARAYAPSFGRRRCLVPADGWYEWRKVPAGAGSGGRPQRKQPYFMTPRDGGVLAFAGLWSVWGRDDDRLMTCSVVTTGAVGEFAVVHDRMPLLLPRQRWADWLGDGSDPAALLAPPSEEFLERLEIRPVGPAVGSVRNNGPGLIERVPAPAPAGEAEGPADLTLF